ncbi:hypothetical protein [Kribbella shirazensis]|uniref:Integral membrane protein n=1 Tax=Kribbella shirazensis TaxID=1105143 RepID=A0A7X5VDL7_9ACTN|nr:hypothetical protein [Kribbella shirazensis]NIK59054.1 hypothetical protein [Kribbella shirazensis]
MPLVIVLVMIAGLSEAAGRVLPLVSRRPGMSRPVVVGLLLTGTLVESAVIASWPWAAWTLAGLLPSTPDADRLLWTPSLIAPLVLAGVIAFPWLGPLLHFVLLTVVGAALAGELASASGIAWGVAAGCVAVAGFGLALAVDVVRRLVARILAIGVLEPAV